MKRNGVASPSDIDGAHEICDLPRFQRPVCPFQLGNLSTLRQLDEEKTEKLGAKAEAILVSWLERHG